MSESHQYKLAVIILNYKTANLVVDCLDSIDKEKLNHDFCVVVVDNDSNDGSTDFIQQAIESRNWGAWAELIESGVNGGFSFGNNLGMSHVSAQSYLLLNSDTLLTAGAIKGLIEFSDKNPEVGIISPDLIWPDGQYQTSSFVDVSPVYELIRSSQLGFIRRILNRFNVPLKHSDKVSYPDWVCFACVLIKRDVIRYVGGLDEKYFMYFEDVDYCKRSRQAGFMIANYPESKVIHFNGGSSGINNKKQPIRELPDYYYRSRTRYFKEHFGRRGLFVANVLWSIGRLIYFIRQIFSRKSVNVQNDVFLKIWGF